MAPEESREAAASEALTESDAPVAPIEAMSSDATAEAVAEAPVEVLATDEPMEASVSPHKVSRLARCALRAAQM
ncbi:protein of unknown function [Cupriavidus taiwanensis]|uniref:Uncharacterized protein n=1 Tax=Cupriavidus taiwanensis TaxID=164546 RepID=A0A375ICA4_9BURK|nr:protein of unknown function [Cupriavidus taiwanensis]